MLGIWRGWRLSASDSGLSKPFLPKWSKDWTSLCASCRLTTHGVLSVLLPERREPAPCPSQDPWPIHFLTLCLDTMAGANSSGPVTQDCAANTVDPLAHRHFPSTGRH